MNEYQKAVIDKKAAYSDKIIQEAKQIKVSKGQITIADIFILADKFEMPVKTTFNILEDSLFFPCGTFQRLQDRGLKVRTEQRKLGLKET